MNIDQILAKNTIEAVKSLYGADLKPELAKYQPTRKEFKGDLTLVVFPLLSLSKKNPEQTANEIGNYLVSNVKELVEFNVIKGFLNVSISTSYWIGFLEEISKKENFGFVPVEDSSETYMVEYSSPNTNKPLHLGHIRNNLLGHSVCEIIKANGKKVIKTNIVNDRGVHICKSMLAWKLFGNGETPQNSGKKGDKLVGEYYVKFDKEYKKQIKELVESGCDEEDAKQKAPIMKDVQEMLRKWEAGDKETLELWETMNSWVYAGFDVTYKKLGITFDKIYYESNTYKVGKDFVCQGVENGVFYKKENGAVWADLTKDGLDEKLLLRDDGTSVYMTQDIGTAKMRYDDYKIDKMIYVVGNEQNYHFQVLSILLDKLGFNWGKDIKHFSYGMVELPEGKMKSREGTVVDADDLVENMIAEAKEISDELGKLHDLPEEEKQKTIEKVALGALKYFMLKVDPKKNMLFNPKESIDFNGNTGPFIQYTYARINSLKRKAEEQKLLKEIAIDSSLAINEKELLLLKTIYQYPQTIKDAGEEFSPAVIANYTYELVKQYNQFYHDCQILKETDEQLLQFRLVLSEVTGKIIKSSLNLLGIEVPNRM